MKIIYVVSGNEIANIFMHLYVTRDYMFLLFYVFKVSSNRVKVKNV